MTVKNSPSLPDLQHWMKSVLVHPDGVESAIKFRRKYLHVIGETPDVSRVDRLSIYGEGYFLRIVDCLGANFNSLRATIGEHAFSHLGRRYLVKHPSTFKIIDEIGHQMSDFLKTDHLTRHYPFLPDYAALEWAAHQSFYAADIPLLDPASLKNIPENQWKAARLQLDPSVRLLALHWPVDELWRADGKVSPRNLKRMKKQPIYLLVYRQEDKQVRVPRLDKSAFDALQAFKRGLSLSRVLMNLAKRPEGPPDPLTVQTWFSDWIRRGVVKGVTFHKSY